MSPRHLALVLLLPPALAVTAAAQTALLANDDGVLSIVRAAIGGRPCVNKDGKLMVVDDDDFALQKVPEYLPVFVSVSDVKAKSTTLVVDGVYSDNNDFCFDATFKAPYHLKNVFMALDLVTEKAGRLISLHEVGELAPYTPRPVSIRVHLAVPIGSWHYVLHLYTGGEEVLQSEIPVEAREQALDRMVATRIKGLQSESPKPFVTPPPEYPSSLKASNLSGAAVISLRIGANGAVYNPVVKSASDPAFGQAALAAVSVWRFLPKVTGGHAVETVVDMPFAFSPAGKR